MWPRGREDSYHSDHLHGKYFNLHKDVCVPLRESLGSYLLSVSPENALCHGNESKIASSSIALLLCLPSS